MRVKGMFAKEVLKKGQISPNILITLIAIVLVLIVGLIVYVVVSDKFGETTLPSGVKVGTPDPVAEQCKSACDTGSKIGFCDVERKVTDTLSTTCKELSTNSQYSSYNVQPCSSIDCNPPATQQADTTCTTGLSGRWESPTSDGKCPVQDGKSARKRTPSDMPPTSGQICCYYY